MKSLSQAAAICAVLSLYASAGQLNPPGPPTAGTMKPLDQVEPRTPIRQADIPLTISTSGSYYLVSNITSSQTAITVAADDVTIDLHGFTVDGPDTAGSYGIYMYGRRNVEIRNGTIRDFGTAVIDTSTGSNDIRLVNLKLMSNLVNGIAVHGFSALVEKCTLTGNGSSLASAQYGIRLGDGATAIENKVYANFNSAAGMVFCISAGEGSRVAANTIFQNGGIAQAVFGIEARSGSVIAENVVYKNGVQGTDLIRGIDAFDCCTVTGNSVSRNGTYAIDVWGVHCGRSCTVVRNTSYENGTSATGSGSGIGLGSNCLVDQNTAYGNRGFNIINRTDCTYGTNHAP